MFSALQIRNYRCFTQFAVRDLARVNVVVGRNNAGKTALLEAVEWAAADGALSALTRSLGQRGEEELMAELEPSQWPHRSQRYWKRGVDPRHLFHGRSLEEGLRASVHAEPSGVLVSAQAVGLNPHNRFDAELSPPVLNLKRQHHGEVQSKDYPLTADGILRVPPPGPMRAPLRFLGTGLAPDRQLALRWGPVAGNPEEELITEILRVVEPALERVIVVGGPPTGRMFVRIQGQERRVPLGSLGEGLRRLLLIAVELVLAQGGVLLIDEIDTGLHFSTLGRLWRFVGEAARRLEVQVFATTHSGDAVNAVGWLHRTEPESVRDFALFRVDKARPEAVRFGPDEIDAALDAEMDLRG